MIVIVADLTRWEREGRPMPAIEGFCHSELRALSRETLRDAELVLSHLMADGIDAVDVARRLQELGYRGRYRAITPPLPLPDSVRSEVRAVAPDLDFDLLTPGPRGGP